MFIARLDSALTNIDYLKISDLTEQLKRPLTINDITIGRMIDKFEELVHQFKLMLDKYDMTHISNELKFLAKRILSIEEYVCKLSGEEVVKKTINYGPIDKS